MTDVRRHDLVAMTSTRSSMHSETRGGPIGLASQALATMYSLVRAVGLVARHFTSDGDPHW